MTSQTSRLFILHRCGRCGGSWVRHEPFPVACDCGGEWMPDRKADNRHWTVRVVANRLRRIRDSANVSASGKFIGLDDAALDFCERVRTAACSDRWCKTILYGIATDLVNAHLNADRGRRTRSATACARYRCRAVKAIDDFGQRLHAAGIARS